MPLRGEETGLRALIQGETALAKERLPGFYQLFMLGLCILVLVAIALESFLNLAPETREILNLADTAVCMLFLIDFGVSLWKAESKFGYLKWGWIDLVSSIPTIGVLRWGRFARVIRILRLFRGIRSARVLVAFILERRQQGALTAAALITLVLIVVSSICILQVERHAGGNIRSADDALWWAFVTITTVGYGDHYPITIEGRVLAAFLMVAGVGLFGTFTGLVASWFLEPESDPVVHEELARVREELAALRQLLAARDAAVPEDARHLTSEPEQQPL